MCPSVSTLHPQVDIIFLGAAAGSVASQTKPPIQSLFPQQGQESSRRGVSRNICSFFVFYFYFDHRFTFLMFVVLFLIPMPFVHKGGRLATPSVNRVVSELGSTRVGGCSDVGWLPHLSQNGREVPMNTHPQVPTTMLPTQ